MTIKLALRPSVFLCQILCDRLQDLISTPDPPLPAVTPEEELEALLAAERREALRREAAILQTALRSPSLTRAQLELPEDEAEGLLRACSALRLAIRRETLGHLPDEALEAGQVQPHLRRPGDRVAYAGYAFLAVLQEGLVEALDPECRT